MSEDEPILTDEELILYHYGEATDPAAVEARLGASPEAARRYAALERLLAVAGQWDAPAPGAGFEAELWQRLRPRLERAAPGEVVSDPTVATGAAAEQVSERPGGRTIDAAHRFGGARRWLPAAAAAALLLVLGYVAGRIGTPAPPVTPVPAVRTATTNASAALSAEARQRILVETLSEHLERSQRLFTEIENAPAGDAAALAGPQQAAHDLLADNRLYRTAAARGGRDGVADLLEEIEPVLSELAHLPAQPDAADVDFLKSRVESRGLLFKTRVASDLLARSLEQKPSRPTRTTL